MGSLLRRDTLRDISIPDVVFEFFRLCKLEPLEIRKGVWQVQIDDVLMKELDGWRAKGRLLQFTFDKKLAETYGAELIGPGSYRINSILELIRKQATLSHAYLPHTVFHEPSIRRKVTQRLGDERASKVYVLTNSLLYDEYLWMVMSISFVTHQKEEQIQTPLVNLASGKLLSFSIPTHLFCSGRPPSENISRRKTTYKQAYTSVYHHLTQEVSLMDSTWATEALDRLQEERSKLEAYYEDHLDEQKRAEKTRELIKRASPKVQIRAIRGAVLYIPLFQYRLMEVLKNGQESIRTIYYDPVSNSLEEAATKTRPD